MSDTWQTQQERGSSTLVRLIAWIALNIGHAAGHVLLYPICFYFLVFSVQARRSSARYLRRALGRRPNFTDMFRHYFCFAATILDRPYFLTGRFAPYDIRIHGEEVLKDIYQSGQGGILMGAHIGSFEVLRCLAGGRDWLNLKVMMYPENSRRIGKILHELNPDYTKNIIALGQPNSVMRAHETIAAGGFVGILADRNSRGGKQVTIPFLGQDAEFPLGPMMLAAVAKCPVVTFFAIYRGGRRYDIYFEELCERAPGNYRADPDALALLVAKFAGRMEARCLDAPYNWFNFFEFWKSDEI